MDPSQQGWFRTAILLGVVYLAIGITFGAVAGSSVSNQMRVAWRLAAWGVSAAAFAAHVAYELGRLRNSPRTTAWHASVAVGLGAFGLAVVANLHALSATAGNQPRLALALVAWPVLLGVPAFLVAFAATTVIALARRSD